jgi:hypothetical protein
MDKRRVRTRARVNYQPAISKGYLVPPVVFTVESESNLTALVGPSEHWTTCAGTRSPWGIFLLVWVANWP